MSVGGALVERWWSVGGALVERCWSVRGAHLERPWSDRGARWQRTGNSPEAGLERSWSKTAICSEIIQNSASDVFCAMRKTQNERTQTTVITSAKHCEHEPKTLQKPDILLVLVTF